MSNTGALIVATPSVDDPINTYVRDPDPHVTMLWFGEAAMLPPDLLDEIRTALGEVTGGFDPFAAKVCGRAILGPDEASVLLLESPELVEIRQELCGYEAVKTAWLMAENQFPWWVIHLTMGYSGEMPTDPPQEVALDALGLWVAEEKEQFPLLAQPEEDPYLASVMVPPVLCLDDLAPAVLYADAHPAARWYLKRRASALGAEDIIPAQWAVAG